MPKSLQSEEMSCNTMSEENTPTDPWHTTIPRRQSGIELISAENLPSLLLEDEVRLNPGRRCPPELILRYVRAKYAPPYQV